jgi:hypothetical protein
MNLNQIRTQARFKSGITNTTTLTNAEIDALVKNAYDFICQKIAQINEDFFEEQKTKANLVQNTGMYALPSDMMKFKQLRIAYSAPSSEDDYFVATPYDPASVDSVSVDEIETATSNPIVDITNNYIRIYPKPTANVTNGLELYYIAKPSSLTNTGDIPVFPAEWHDLLSTYAARETCLKFEQLDKWKILKQDWEEGVVRMIEGLNTRNINSPQRFRNVLETTKKSKTTELY